MSSRSGSSTMGTSRPARMHSAVSRVRPKRVWTHRSSGSSASWWPSRAASARPSAVRATGTRRIPVDPALVVEARPSRAGSGRRAAPARQATCPLLEWPGASRSRGAPREPRPADGAGAVARRPPRRRARRVRPRQVGEDPRLPEGQGAAPRARRARRPRAPHGRGRRQPHRRLVLERGRAVARPPGRAARVRLRAARVGGRGLAVHRDRRRAGEARARRLDGARGRRVRGGGARGARRARARGACARPSPSSSPSRAGPSRRTTRSSSTSCRPTARRGATTSSSSAAAPSSTRSSRASSA